MAPPVEEFDRLLAMRALLGLAADVRPAAVFCVSDTPAVGGAVGRARGGLTVPGDIASLAVQCLATRIRSDRPLPFEVHLARHWLGKRESTAGVRRPLEP